jgi:uncharacterized protein YndB with AHSA1/START domain
MSAAGNRRVKNQEVVRWFRPARFKLVSYDADFRKGGTARYVFQRPSGARMEMQHLYSEVDPPHRWVHSETYDFSPLQILVTTALNEVNGRTVFTQRLLYSSNKERDADFDAVASSAEEICTRLEQYLESR